MALHKPSVHKLSSTDAFVVTDIAEAPATGVVRAGKKILESSATDLARSATYTFAAFGMQRSGASAGINALDDEVAAATAAFCAELEATVRTGELHLDPGKGTSEQDLAPLIAAADRHPLAGSLEATVAGVIAAAGWANGGTLGGASVAIEGDGPIPEALAEAVTAAGATVMEIANVATKPWLIWGATADLILAGSKPGTLTHQGVPMFKAKAVVPWGPIPFTTKAFADLRKAGVIVVPDFLSAAGATIVGYLDDPSLESISSRITDVLEDSQHDDGVLLGACYRAETFLQTWVSTPLFGRPLAA